MTRHHNHPCRRVSRTNSNLGLVSISLMMTAVMAWGSAPALAHGGDGESDPVNLAEQALAIVVNTPDAPGEAIERVEEALAIESEEASGELDLAALEEALAALEEGRLHDAEDALVTALGRDPHVEESEAVESPVPAEPEAPSEAEAPPDSEAAPPTEEPTDPDTVGTVVDEHGLTSRVEGGIVTPGPSDLVALVAAFLLAGAGLVVWRRKEGSA